MDNQVLTQLKQAIRNIAPMAEADMAYLDEIELKTRKVKKNNFVLTQGEVCTDIFFLSSGLFRMYYVDFYGNEINCRFTFSGSFFVDFQSLLTGQPSRYYWQAMEDSSVFILDSEAVQRVYRKCHNWEFFGRKVAESVYLQVSERIEMLEFLSPEERYLRLLNKTPELFSKISLRHISSYLGIKPESLSRLRKRLISNKQHYPELEQFDKKTS